MLWGSRFEKGLDNEAMAFSSSLYFDINLFEEDIEGSIAHAKMLAKVGIIQSHEAEKICSGLFKIKEAYVKGNWNPDPLKFEDIHSAIESELTNLIGDVAGKLHSGRSRNDQITTAVKLWLKKKSDKVFESQIKLQKVLLNIAKNHTETIMPGYTHLQRAQPISFAFHLLAYIEMLERDKKRILFAKEATDISALGSGAIAGSTLPLDREFTAKILGFKSVGNNAMDSISERDFLLDFLNACNLGMMHLSRLTEELINWSSKEWGFIKIGDQYTTGSSLMPQKKNPDMAELIRGKSGRVFGNYISLLTTMKGLPLSYNRDLQEDKEPVFDSARAYLDSLNIMAGMMGTINVNADRFKKELEGDFSLATDLADWLVLKGIPFRESHHIVGKVVNLAEDKNKKLNDLTIDDLKSINTIFDKSALKCFEISTALQRKVTYGSPNPKLVSGQIENWELKLSN
ncbi:MAG: argininosuccinate lyase [Melioribacteraceae bacterium]|nr:argininosuccinate lyase [Melioribacteraceae bacterium]